MVPPTGTVALVFTDIESSTSHWERHGDGFRPVLDLHDAVMRRAIAEHGGYEVKTEGDAFMIAFGTAADAVRACLAAQRALHAADWPAAFLGDDPAFRGPRVRMGVHVGAPICRPDPLTGRMDYYGPVVNRAARIGAAAHGGQVLISADALPAGVPDADVVDLGEHGLKGIEGRIRLHGAVPRGLARTFPPPRTVAARRSNLPHPATSFVGRQPELASVAAALDVARLVTLVGPAGVGKTRLAVHAAAAAMPGLPGGAWLCAASGGARSVAEALEVPLTDRDADAQLARALVDRGRILLVLDDADAGPSIAPLVERWLGAAPDVRVLVTSREPLGGAGERLVGVEPLSPEDAVTLLLERGRAVRPDLQVDDTIRRIARDLDGLPLALELAAARLHTLSPPALLARLDRHLDLLRAPGSSKQTLRGAIDASWDALADAERTTLAWLSVFRGSFSLEDAEAVVSVDDVWVVDAVTRLHERSLVRRLGDRYALLASIRAYAAEKLADRSAAEARHGAWVTSIREPALRDLDDLLAARDRALTRGDVALAASATVAAITVYRQHGPLRDVAGLVTAFDGKDPDARARVQAHAGGALVMADPERARALLEEARSGAEPAATDARMHLADLERLAGRPSEAEALLADPLPDDPTRAGRVWRRRGLVHAETGRLDAARDAFERSRRLAASGGDRHGEALSLANLAIVYSETGHALEAIAALDDAIAAHGRLGARVDQAIATQNRANLLIELGRYDEAFAGYEHAIAIHRAVGNRRFEGAAVCNLGILHANTGDLDAAERHARAAQDVARAIGDQRYVLLGEARLGAIDVQRGRYAEARDRLDAVALALEAQGDRQNLAVVQTDLARAVAAVGDLDRAEDLLAVAEATLRAGQWRYDLVGALLARAEVDRLRGREPDLAEAASVARAIDLSPRTLPGRRLAAATARASGLG